MLRRCVLSTLSCLAFTAATVALGSDEGDSRRSAQQSDKKSPKQSMVQPLSPAEELQKAISDAGNDRAALVRNLRAYLDKFPEAPQRPQIYRAMVEACMQSRDDACAADYAERIVALTPEDSSMTLLAVELLERHDDPGALRRSVTYLTRVYESVKSTPVAEKSPRVSLEEWESQKKRNESELLALRGRVEGRLNDGAAERSDYQASYELQPNPTAAVRLGELEELGKNYSGAATQYARAFALTDTATKSGTRREIRQKLGNAWRLAHGSEAGLGDFLLKTVDEVTAASVSPRPPRNAGLTDPFSLVLRKAPDGTAYPMAAQKGKVLVVKFWATWCGPCHALEPIYEKVVAQYAENASLVFLSADCDEDEALVGPYLARRHPRATEVFADRLEELFGVNSFPTLLILDPSGKVAFRANGFDPDTIEKQLSTAIEHIAGAAPNAAKTTAFR